MSLAKAVVALDALSDYDLETLAYIVERRRSATSAERLESSEHKAPKSAAERQREKRERERASRGVTETRDMSRDTVTKNVTSGVTSRDEYRDNVTPPASVRALSSLSFSEESSEKESTGASVSRPVTGDVTRTVTRSVTPDVTRDMSRASVTKSAGGELMAKAEAVRVALTDGFKRHGIAAPARHLSLPHSQPVIDIARSIEESDLPKLIEGFFADDGTRKKGYPIAWLANNPAAYMTAFKEATSPAARPSNLTDHEHHALNREEAVAKGARVKGPDPMHLASAKAKIAAAQQARAS